MKTAIITETFTPQAYSWVSCIHYNLYQLLKKQIQDKALEAFDHIIAQTR